MPLLKLRTHGPADVLTALEMRVLDHVKGAIMLTVNSYAPDAEYATMGGTSRADARRVLSALWRRGLLTRVGWGDAAVYRRRP